MKKILFAFMALLTGCASQPTVPTALTSTEPGTSVTFGGNPAKLYSKHTVKKGDQFPAISLKDSKLKDFTLEPNGKVKLISVVPSIDTPVCEIQTHELAETTLLHPNVERITVSMDLPFAQERFKNESHLGNVSYFSDFDGKHFGQSTGTLVPEKGILARALFVVDGKGILRYYQVVPEVAEKPDMNRAVQEANRWVEVPNEKM